METVIRKSLKLKSCPKCGGDVCRTRDTFGVYHQCAQCGREIRIGMSGAPLDAGLALDASLALDAGLVAHTTDTARGATAANPTEPKMELVV